MAILGDLIFGPMMDRRRLAQYQAEQDIAQRRQIAEANAKSTLDKALLAAATEEELRRKRLLPSIEEEAKDLALNRGMSRYTGAANNSAFMAVPEGVQANQNLALSSEAKNALGRALGATDLSRSIGAAQANALLNAAQASGSKSLLDKSVTEGMAPFGLDYGKSQMERDISGARADTGANRGKLLTQEVADKRAQGVLSDISTVLGIDKAQRAIEGLGAGIRQNLLTGAAKTDFSPREQKMAAIQTGLKPQEPGTVWGDYHLRGPSENVETVIGPGGIPQTKVVRQSGELRDLNTLIRPEDYAGAGIRSPGAANPSLVIPESTVPLMTGQGAGLLSPAVIPKSFIPREFNINALVPPVVSPDVTSPSASSPNMPNPVARLGELQKLRDNLNKQAGGAFVDSLEIGLDGYPANMATREILSRIKPTLKDPKQLQVLDTLEKLTDAELNLIFRR